ncbi:hypothetical protein HAX54_001695 [Datura stramonium]|uniref:Uncharacterized protein n=1 Tax=Datura stramonium TaxID=4076 RepID=A0ABS8T509_DATST|nr:hypothetical protein [Datura stramonium]
MTDLNQEPFENLDVEIDSLEDEDDVQTSGKLIKKRRSNEYDIIQDGFKGAATTCALTSLVVFAAARYCPWAKANINYAGKTFIISSLTAASFAFTAEQSMVKKHRGHGRWDSS